jgi:hypothetical protein
MTERREPGNVTTVSLAPSLACFLWAAAVAAQPSLHLRLAGEAPGHRSP